MTPGPGVARTILPIGFSASGVNSGVRRYRPDLGLIVSDRNAVGVGVFTKSASRAAPVLCCQSVLPSRSVRAIVTNSGQANAATGPSGVRDNLDLARAVAEIVGCRGSDVLTASTGVIGVPLDMHKILPAIPEAFHRCVDVAEPFALAILTTDLVPKTFSTQIDLTHGPVNITGIAKGSGMIHPNMATMLAYILTDAEVDVETAQGVLTRANADSFNMISVDGDTSTNDCCFLLANGASGVSLANERDRQLFEDAVVSMSIHLAKSITRDGEGASKLIEVVVENAPSDALARRLARSITMSPLIKTAVHGADPNWGRIFARIGAELADLPEACVTEKLDMSFQSVAVMKHGAPLSFAIEDLRGRLKRDTVCVRVDLNSGDARATAWGCDLSKKYVDINASYTS